MATDAAKLEQIRATIADRGVEFIFAQFVDLYGRPSAKLVPAAELDGLVEDGAGFAGFAAGEIGQLPSDPDIAAIPDLDSFTLVPWQPNLARFACDVTVESEAWPYCPRTILRNGLAKAAAQGFEFKIGIELEYFLVQLNADGTIEIADKLDTLEKPCYDMAGLTRQYDFLTRVSKYCNELGWGNYANDHEDANGQFEQNFEFDNALVTCDRAIFFRYMVHTLAEQHGMLATFMPKPFTSLTGNGAHLHMSLWRDGVNAFLDEADPRGLGLSEAAYDFIGGPQEPRTCLQRADGSDGQLVQAAEARLDLERRHLVAGVDLLWLQRPHADAAHSCSGPRSRTARSTARATRTWPRLRCSPPASTASRTASTRGNPTRRTCTASPTTSSPDAASAHCPRRCTTQRRSSSETTCSAPRSGARDDEDYVDYYLRVKRDEWFRYHEQVSAGRCASI